MKVLKLLMWRIGCCANNLLSKNQKTINLELSSEETIRFHYVFILLSANSLYLNIGELLLSKDFYSTTSSGGLFSLKATKRADTIDL